MGSLDSGRYRRDGDSDRWGPLPTVHHCRLATNGILTYVSGPSDQLVGSIVCCSTRTAERNVFSSIGVAAHSRDPGEFHGDVGATRSPTSGDRCGAERPRSKYIQRGTTHYVSYFRYVWIRWRWNRLARSSEFLLVWFDWPRTSHERSPG